MSLANDFESFCGSKNFELSDEMDTTIKEITKKLNSKYYDLSSEEKDHMYIVGSMGRMTAVKSSSDLDLLFDLPDSLFSKYDSYGSNGQSELLQNVKEILMEHYPKTFIKGDGQVVVIEFTKYTVELVPAFKQSDGKFKYPDTHNGGSWKYTDPLSEQNECMESSKKSSGAFINFCHIIREWKNNEGFKFGGLLIDTFVFNHLNSCAFEDDYSFDNYLEILKNILDYVGGLDKNQSYWYALGSNQKIFNNSKGNFVSKAKKTLKQIQDAESNEDDMNDVLREILGNDFPKSESSEFLTEESLAFEKTYDNTEKFIEDVFPVDIRYSLQIDCCISQNGFRTFWLRKFPNKYIGIKKELKFSVTSTDCQDYDVFWKVRNVGNEAIRRNCIRGQIVKGNNQKIEHSQFNGNHYVECYLVKNGVCVARDRIDVPISMNVSLNRK
ncbi:nucleotidyltransferase [Limosilactobacillus fermentum]|uniref:nucleotide-binding domain-containing protein n=1 Tax=Limosilactobacillus fermentum TaxID=1613 RepID=UPI0021A52804|nr:nucleotidyltransferase [Limosilactobacillus fermentum]MCT3440156.1 nucleotidyltransferase [Limosilactobacillus fermentum]MCT3450700.1 nucleotidyltransferase [Limosilactobacillus fermentum]